MNYVKVINGSVEGLPLSILHLVSTGVFASNPPTTEELTANNLVEVSRNTEKCPYDQFVYDLKVVQQQDGTWAEKWVKVDATEWQTQSRIDFATISAINKRDHLLQLSDWTQLPDVAVANKPAWVAYRQALRDVPAQSGFPFSIDWPVKP